MSELFNNLVQTSLNPSVQQFTKTTTQHTHQQIYVVDGIDYVDLSLQPYCTAHFSLMQTGR